MCIRDRDTEDEEAGAGLISEAQRILLVQASKEIRKLTNKEIPEYLIEGPKTTIEEE